MHAVQPVVLLNVVSLNVFSVVGLYRLFLAQCDCCLSILKSLPNLPTLVQNVFIG